MKGLRWLFVSVLVTGGIGLYATIQRPRTQPNTPDEQGRTVLPNGWKVTPAGQHIALDGDMPTKIVVRGNLAYVVTNGYHHTGLSVVDLNTEKVLAFKSMQATGPGLDFDGSTAFVSGGKNSIQAIPLGDHGVEPGSSIAVDQEVKPGKRYMGGVAFGHGSLFTVDTGRNLVRRYEGSPLVKAVEAQAGLRPYTCVLSPDGETLAVSSWGTKSVLLYTAQSLTPKGVIEVGTHPTEMAWAKDGRLFVVNAGSNSVSLIENGRMTETIKTSVEPHAKVGSTPDSVALSPDGSTLYVANADNNCVAVIDVHLRGSSRVVGFIPTGWYPSSVAVTPDGKHLLVGTGKGMKFRPNWPAQGGKSTSTASSPERYDYIGNVLSGWLSIVEIGDQKQLAAYTAQVRSNMPVLADSSVSKQTVRDVTDRALSKIKHVVYIIRENRTYDQVLSDIPGGNGDTSILFFGEDVTPNAHKLAREYVLFDNLYCNGEVSQDGHQWCNAAYATLFTERAYTSSYGGKGMPDDDEGVTASPAGYLWDACQKAGLSYLSYGEGAQFSSNPSSAPVFSGPGTLKGHTRLDYKGRDTEKAALFIEDLQKAEKSGEWPNYMVMSLGEDHTSGLKAGAYTPQACVASNDLALGRMVDAVSHSRFWKETAFFVIEDDAQNGPDHVDAHRTVGLVISPYTRRHFIDSTLYTTSSMVRTMELILGLSPMTQFDEKATPMVSSFTERINTTPYSCEDARIDLQAKNPTKGDLAILSAKLDWSGYDRADPDELNRILWKALKPGRKMPAPVRSAVLPR